MELRPDPALSPQAFPLVNAPRFESGQRFYHWSFQNHGMMGRLAQLLMYRHIN
jgi:hypothetical protein